MKLRAHAALPSNFDYIMLSKKEKEKVIAGGANPYRMEGELPGEEALDEEGKPRPVFD